MSFFNDIDRTITTTTGTALYTVRFRDYTNPHTQLTVPTFRGGTLKLTATATVNSRLLTGSTPGSLAIKGTNPGRPSIQQEIDNVVDSMAQDVQSYGLNVADVKSALKRMACQETAQRQAQFAASPSGGIALPIISPDNGVGVFQITNTQSCSRGILFPPQLPEPPNTGFCQNTLFNWKANIAEAISLFVNEKIPAADAYPEKLRNNFQYRLLIAKRINPIRTDPNRPGGPLLPIPTNGELPTPDFRTTGVFGNIDPDNMTRNQLLEDAVRSYNGFSGSLVLQLVRISGGLHEFMPNIEFLKNVPNAQLPTLNSNPQVWMRSPIAPRGSSGDPNYFFNVFSRDSNCSDLP